MTVKPFKQMGVTPTQQRLADIEARLVRIEQAIRHLSDALGFTMLNLEQRIKSPIVGGEDRTISIMDRYKRAKEQQVAETETQH